MTYDDLITALKALPPGATSALIVVKATDGNVGEPVGVEYQYGEIVITTDLALSKEDEP